MIRRIREGKVKDSFKLLAKEFDFIIAEGAGGALVPLNKKNLLIDITKKLVLELILLLVIYNKRQKIKVYHGKLPKLLTDQHH